MTDYISREAVLEEMKTWVCCSEGERKMLEITKKWLKGYPAADVVKVVRCKDCKHKEREQPGMVYCPMMVGSWVADDHFCAWGERSEDAEIH